MSSKALWDRLNREQWTLIQRWLDESEPESLVLDFKRGGFDSNKNTKIRLEDQANLAKCLSAFGNADGGLIVFGIATKKLNNQDIAWGLQAEVPEAPNPFDAEAYKGALEQLVSDRVTPVIPGVDVKAFRDPNDSTRGVVAVYVPVTTTGPYRAVCSGKSEVHDRYWLRSTVASTVMPHTTLAAMFNRVAVPQLELRAEPAKRSFTFFVVNTGRSTADGIRVCVELHASIPPHLAMGLPQTETETERLIRWEADPVWKHIRAHWPPERANSRSFCVTVSNLLYPQDVFEICKVTASAPIDVFDVRLRLDAQSAQPTFTGWLRASFVDGSVTPLAVAARAEDFPSGLPGA